jgi:hypothetical protein
MHQQEFFGNRKSSERGCEGIRRICGHGKSNKPRYLNEGGGTKYWLTNHCGELTNKI